MIIIPTEIYTYLVKTWDSPGPFKLVLLDKKTATKQQLEELKQKVAWANGIKTSSLYLVTLKNTGFTVSLLKQMCWFSYVKITNTELESLTNFDCAINLNPFKILTSIVASGYINNYTLSGVFYLRKFSGFDFGLELDNANEELYKSIQICKSLDKRKTNWKSWIPGHKYQISYDLQVIFLGTLPYYLSSLKRGFSIIQTENYRQVQRIDQEIPVLIRSDNKLFDANHIKSFKTNLDFLNYLFNNVLISNSTFETENRNIKGVDLGEVFSNECSNLDFIFSTYCINKVKNGYNIHYLSRVNKECIKNDKYIKQYIYREFKTVLLNIFNHDNCYSGVGISRIKPTDSNTEILKKLSSYTWGPGVAFISIVLNNIYIDLTQEEILNLIEEAKNEYATKIPH